MKVLSPKSGLIATVFCLCSSMLVADMTGLESIRKKSMGVERWVTPVSDDLGFLDDWMQSPIPNFNPDPYAHTDQPRQLAGDDAVAPPEDDDDRPDSDDASSRTMPDSDWFRWDDVDLFEYRKIELRPGQFGPVGGIDHVDKSVFRDVPAPGGAALLIGFAVAAQSRRRRH